MKLFNKVVDDNKLHQNFVNVLKHSSELERAELERWAEGFPDRDGKFVKEFQTTFNSSFWEVYLNAVFRDYNFKTNWAESSPDFCLNFGNENFIVEATTANAAKGKPNEWNRSLTAEEISISFNALNRESIIRLANSFLGKLKYYRSKYIHLNHVKGKPFVLALAPFEQPHFNLQYNRPIVALLYDYYVDEDAFRKNPSHYPDGPPSRSLGYVTKENDAEIPLGMFCDDRANEISAVIFSCTATWGKVDAMVKNPAVTRYIQTVWGTEPNGVPQKRFATSNEYSEKLTDGLQVYHNPFARYPLSPELFRQEGVVQCFANPHTRELFFEGESSCLMYRIVHTIQTYDNDLLEKNLDPSPKIP